MSMTEAENEDSIDFNQLIFYENSALFASGEQ